MADERARLGIEIDPTTAKSGAKEVEVALGKVGAAATKAVGAAEKAAAGAGTAAGKGAAAAATGGLNAIQALEGKLKLQQANLQKAVKAGLLTPEEAARAGREAGAAFAREMQQAFKGGQLAGLDQGGVFKAGGQSFIAFNGQLRSVSDYSKSAGQGISMMRESVASLAAQMAGVHPVFGRLATLLGTMAMGGALTVGVLAGIAAIGYAFTKATAETRKQKEETQKLIDKLRQLRQERTDPTREQKVDVWAMQAMLARLDARIAEAKRLSGSADPATARVHAREVERAEAERLKLLPLLQEAQQQLNEAERDRLQTMREFRQAGPEIIEQTHREAAAVKKLGEDTKELARIEEYRERMRLQAARGTIFRGSTFAGTGVYGGGTVRGPAMPGTLDEEAAAAAANAAAGRAAKVMEQIWTEAIRGIQQAMAGGFEEIFQNGLAGFDKFADAIVGVFRKTAAQIAAAMASKALGLDKAIAELGKTGGTAGGAWGALSGAGQFGIAVGAMVGIGKLTEAIFGAGDAAEEAARQMQEYIAAMREQAFGSAEGFISKYGTADPQAELWKDYTETVTELDAAMRNGFISLEEYYAQLALVGDLYVKESERIRKAAEDAAAAAAAREKAEAEAEATRKAASIEDLGVRLLMAQGRTAEAEAMRTQLDRNRELAAARTEEEKAMLRQIYAAEDLTAATNAAAAAEAAAAEEAKRKAASIEDLNVRLLMAQGRTEEAETLRKQLARTRELAAARSEEERAILRQIYAAEDATAAADALAESLAAAAAAAKMNAEGMEDLNVRHLAANGQDREAAIERKRLEQKREYEEAVAKGYSRDYLDQLMDVLADEWKDFMGDLEAAALEAAAALVKLNSEVSEDLTVREMRAGGKDREADIEEFRINQRREYDRAVAAGWSKENLDRLFNLQKDELQDFIEGLDSKYRTGSAAVNPTGEADAEVIRSVKGISETTAVRMADLTRTSNIWLAEIAWNTRALRGDGIGVFPGVGGGTGRNITVTVNVSGNVTAAQANTVGANIGAGLSAYLQTGAKYAGEAAA